MTKGTILVTDDDAFFRNLYTEILKEGGYNVLTANSGKEAISIVESHDLDVVITDLIMPDISGQVVLERTKQYNALIDVIVITGHGTIDSAIAALKSGAYDYIRKPINHEELLLTVNRCLEQKRLIEENQGLKKSLKLFEVNRTITSCLEIEKLYDLTLDALLQEIPGEAGICLFYNKNGNTFVVKAARHLDDNGKRMLAEIFRDRYVEKLAFDEDIEVFDRVEVEGEGNGRAFAEYHSILVAKLRKDDVTAGYVLILNRSKKAIYKDIDVGNATFIIDQASLTFENAEKFKSAKEMAYVDSLTDLYNPRFLDIALERELKRSNRSRIPFSILFLDLDHFKKVNDVNGHLVGSKVLVEVGHLIVSCVRDIDTVIRYGGDEFTIILVDTNYETAYRIAERIRRTIENHAFLEESALSLKITASIGLATYPIHAREKKDLLEIADRAMYCGKNTSRNIVYLAPIPESGDSV